MNVFCTDELKYWLRRDLMKGNEAAQLLSDLLPEHTGFEGDNYLTGRLIRCGTICLWPEQATSHMVANRTIYHESLIRLERSVAEKIDSMRQDFENGEMEMRSLEEWLSWAINKNFKINWLAYALDEGFFSKIKSRIEADEILKKRYFSQIATASAALPASDESSVKQPTEAPIDEPLNTPPENIRKRMQQHEMILAIIAALEFDPLRIPDGGKAKIKTVCLTRPRIFTDASFDHAWKAGLSADLFRLANHEKFSPK